MEAKIKKLPKWAQSYIRDVLSDNENLTEALSIQKDEYPESNTYYSLWRDLKFTKHWLPNSTHLTVVGNGTKVSMFVDQYGQIRIDIGYGLIKPQARNSIYIVPED